MVEVRSYWSPRAQHSREQDVNEAAWATAVCSLRESWNLTAVMCCHTDVHANFLRPLSLSHRCTHTITGNPLIREFRAFHSTASVFFLGGSIWWIVKAKKYFHQYKISKMLGRMSHSNLRVHGASVQRSSTVAGWLAGSVQVKMNNLGNTKKSMWHL